MNQNNPLVSIIMPVYNGERFLSDAIESVISQSYKNWELLIVDDGSEDKSIQIIKAYAEKDSRIRLYRNQSGEHGPGIARNYGIERISGRYTYFIDADDWIDKELLQSAVNRMQETNADIVQFGVIYERNDGNTPQQYYWRGKNLLTKDEMKKDFFDFWNENRNSLWIHFFRRETVKTIRFENIIDGEDISYIMDALCKAEKITYISKALYHYRYVEGSVSHRWKKETLECRLIIYRHQKNFLKSFNGGIEKLAYAEVSYDNYLWYIYSLSANLCPLSYKDKKRELLILKEKMGFNEYRGIYPLKLKHGIEKVKYLLVKYHSERLLLLLGPVFLRIVRGE